MGQGILRNMWVYPGLSIPELGAGLQLDDVGAMEWQSL